MSMPFTGQRNTYPGDLGGRSMVEGMGAVGGRSTWPKLPSMGGISGKMDQYDVGPNHMNSGQSNQLNPITMATTVDLTDGSGTELQRYEFLCQKRNATNASGTGHVVKTWCAMNQYLWENEGQSKYGQMKHHAQETGNSQGLSVDWAMLIGTQVNDLEHFKIPDMFDEYVTNIDRGRRAETFNYWAADTGVAVREPGWLFGILLKFAFDNETDSLAQIADPDNKYAGSKRKLFDARRDALTHKKQKDTERMSSSRHFITWQLVPYVDISPAGPDMCSFTNPSGSGTNADYNGMAFTGKSYRLGMCTEFYPSRRCSEDDEAAIARTALYPHIRGMTGNWKTTCRDSLSQLSRVVLQVNL